MDNIEANNCSATELGLVPGSALLEQSVCWEQAAASWKHRAVEIGNLLGDGFAERAATRAMVYSDCARQLRDIISQNTAVSQPDTRRNPT